MSQSMPRRSSRRRVAREIPPAGLVNLGIGLPTLVTAYLPPGIGVFFQTENGLAGVGPRPAHGMGNPNLVDAGGGLITAIPGAASFDSTFSFGLIRGGHLDLTVLGGLQVDSRGRLANWVIPGKMVPGMGGAMDLVTVRSASSSPWYTAPWAIPRSSRNARTRSPRFDRSTWS